MCYAVSSSTARISSDSVSDQIRDDCDCDDRDERIVLLKQITSKLKLVITIIIITEWSYCLVVKID